MLDPAFIRTHAKEVEENAARKGVTVDVGKIVLLDAQHRDVLRQSETVRAQQKAASTHKPDAATQKKLRTLSAEAQEFRAQERALGEQLDSLLRQLPAMVRPDVPVGKDERDNAVVRLVGKPPSFEFPAKDYLALGEALDFIDVTRAGKVSGSRFGYLKNGAALLEFALVQYALDLLVRQSGFTFMVPPVMIGEDAMRAMGYLEHGGEADTYHFPQDRLFLVGTSEQSLGPYHKDEVLDAGHLPLRYCAFSTCFRREAGAAGKDTRGILRVHQFDKLEMFVFCKPEDSDREHDGLLALEEKLMQGLGLAYRVVNCCTGELGLPAAKKYDIETWLPSQQRYRETHSSSNCVDFQARRLNIRYKNTAGGKNEFVHTLNGTAFAIPRMIAVLLEHGQQADGTIRVPTPLRPYLPGSPEVLGK